LSRYTLLDTPADLTLSPMTLRYDTRNLINIATKSFRQPGVSARASVIVAITLVPFASACHDCFRHTR
jgi:hypothetical protein